MQRENTDPEKINLLQDKNSDRNQRKYSGSAVKSKSDKTNKTDTSVSNKEKHASTKQTVYNVGKETRSSRTRDIPIRHEKIERWWRWTEADNSDTCSCVSCSLKKIVKSDKVGCLCFAISVAVIFLLILPPLGYLKISSGCMKKDVMDSEMFSKKIDLLKDGEKRNNRDGVISARSSGSNADQAFAERNLQERMDHLDVEATLSPELSNIIDINKINNESSEKLKNFFKKLLVTEAKIKNLKKSLNNVPQVSSINTNFMEPDIDRTKRSLKSVYNPELNKRINLYEATTDTDLSRFSLFYPPYNIFHKPKNKVRQKRNNKTEPRGFIFEKEQLVIKYEPKNKKIIPKCSHMPKESNSHENEMKHPFYKNTQRLDELLDNFFNKNFRNIILSQPFFNNDFVDNSTEKCKHNKYPKNDYLHENIKNDKITQNVNANKEKVENEILAKDYSTNDPFPTLMEVSTDFLKDADNYKINENRDEKSPIARKLMQIDEKGNNEDSLAENVKLIINDSANKDSKQHDRIKRVDQTSNDRTQDINQKYLEPRIHGPNWKGPMPLYPDEINSMIKQAAIRAVNKISFPVNPKDIPPEFDGTEQGLKDLESFEEYIDGKYDKVVKMAQAYSDYGVLNAKKIGNEKSNDSKNDNRIRLSSDKVRSNIFHRLKAYSPSNNDAVLAESVPENAGDDPGLNLLSQFLQKHIKFSSPPNFTTTTKDLSDFRPFKFYNVLESDKLKKTPYLNFETNSDRSQKLFRSWESASNSTKYDDREIIKSTDKNPINNEGSSDNTIIFTVRQFKRSLKSIEETIGVYGDSSSEIQYSVPKESMSSQTNSIYRNTTAQVIINNNHESINITNATSDQINKNSNLKNKSNINATIREDSTPFDFLSMLANVFSAFAGIPSNNSSDLSIVEPKHLANLFGYTNTISTTEVMYPTYDADMIENIGHRSRVILSIENANSNDSYIKSAIKDKVENSTEINLENNMNITNSTEVEAFKNDLSKRETNKTKTVVKRNVQNNNSVPWNDIYDDEYGVKYDLIDKIERNKHSASNDSLVNKSKKWFKDKAMKWSLKNKKQKKKEKKRPPRDVSFGWDGDNFESYDDSKIYSNVVAEDRNSLREEYDKKSSFSHLNSKMEEYFQRAVKAIRETENSNMVREESKDDQLAATLMHQLVRLMSDVVDYQVHRKTCLKLPEYLSNFLTWLTAPDEKSDSGRLKILLHDDISDDYQHSNTIYSDQSNLLVDKETELHQDPRVEGEKTINSLQNLMMEFDRLSNYDKMNLMGVREYLQNQFFYLRHLLHPNTYDVYNPYMQPESLRFRRSPRAKSGPAKPTKRKKNRRKRKLDKFVKNFSKKHTKTTARFIDSVNEITEPAFGASLRDTSQNGGLNNKENGGFINNNKPTRNLQDVYYRALQEAKKFTTIKTSI